MEHRLSSRVLRIKPSATLALTARAKALAAEGKAVIALTAGEPEFETPMAIREYTIAELKKGGQVSRYTPAAGLIELRKAVAAKFKRDNGLEYSPEQCIVSCGAKHSIFNALAALVEDGDEVLVPSPYWVSYPEMCAFLGAKAVAIDTSRTGMVLTPEALKAAITPKTRVLLVNSPGNPTGAVWSEAQQRALAAVLEGSGIYVISDEIYEKLVYDGRHFSFAACSPDAYSRTITVNGSAKAFAMTGWRVGYAAGPKPVIDAMVALQSHSTSNAASVSQVATIKALEKDPVELPEWRACYVRRRDAFLSALNALPGVSCAKPGGAFYVFPDIRGWLGKHHGDTPLNTDTDVCDALLAKSLVATVPGVEFGAPGFLRISYALSDRDVAEALKRLKEFAAAVR
ncbi:aspartate aminotransferase [Planctomycetaceae bacterium]|nr:aspartate aminotransferase [Planctomycetaceae bacterium]